MGGIYIRLLIQNPGWQLRRPREFITVLFDKIVELTAPTNGEVDNDLLTALAEAGCGLFYTQKNLTKMGKKQDSRSKLECIIIRYLFQYREWESCRR